MLLHKLLVGAALVGYASAVSTNRAFDKLDSCAHDCVDEVLKTGSTVDQACSDPTDTDCQCRNGFLKELRNCLHQKQHGTCPFIDEVYQAGNSICWPLDSQVKEVQTTTVTDATATYTSLITITSAPSTEKPKSEKPTPTNLSEAMALLKSGHFDRATSTPESRPTDGVYRGNKATAGAGVDNTLISGVTVGGLLALGFFGLAIFCICRKTKRRRNAKGKKLDDDAEYGSGADKYTGGADKKGKSHWYSRSNKKNKNEDHYGGTERSMPDATEYNTAHNAGLGYNKEYTAGPSVPQYPQTSYDYTKTQVASAPAKKYPERISLTYAPQPQRPSLTLQSPVIVLPQATVDEYSPSDSKRNSLRYSQQSAKQHQQQQQQQQQQQDGRLQPSNINIPLMFFTPATPQMNVSPISQTRSSAGHDIFEQYAAMKTIDSSVGIAQSTPGKTQQEYSSSNAPSPPPAYTFQPMNPQKTAQTMKINPGPACHPVTMTPNKFPLPPSADDVSAVPRTMPPAAGIYLTGNRNSNPHPATSADPGPPPHDRAPTPPEAAYTGSYPSGTDFTTSPSTINRANSAQWRMSVERAADKAMDRVRYSIGSRCDDVPEEEERLTQGNGSGESEEEMSRGRSKWRRSTTGGHSPSRRQSLQRPHSRRATTGSVASVDLSGSRSRSRNGRSSISLTRAMDRSASRRASGNVMMV